MIVRAAVITLLSGFGIFTTALSPVEFEDPTKVFRQKALHDEVHMGLLKGKTTVQMSSHSPLWWKHRFTEEAAKPIEDLNTHHLIASEDPYQQVLDLGTVILRKTDDGLVSECLIQGLNNATLRYSTKITAMAPQQPPTWWPKAFTFESGGHVGEAITAWGRYNHSSQIKKNLPSQGKPWVKIDQGFYLGRDFSWIAYAHDGIIRLIKQPESISSYERQ